MHDLKILPLMNLCMCVAGLDIGVDRKRSITDADLKQNAIGLFEALKECEAGGFLLSYAAIHRMIAVMKEHGTWGDYIDEGRAFRQRLIDEMDLRIFLQASNPKRYRTPLEGWNEVITRFPELQTDIEEAGRCSATARYTASVFHLMRVLEGGLDGIAKILTPNEEWFSSWDAYLRKLNEAWKARYSDPKNEEHRKWIRFFGEIERHFYAIKIALRNPTMHKVEKTYTEEAAEDVYRQVRSLMRYLAVELPR